MLRSVSQIEDNFVLVKIEAILLSAGKSVFVLFESSTRLSRILTVVARCRRRGGLSLVAAADLEDDLHVVAGAPSADAPVEIVLGRGADEVVIVAREELEAPRLRRERPERDGEVHRFARLVAHRYYPRTRVCYPTCLVLLLGHLQNAQEKFCGQSRRYNRSATRGDARIGDTER